MTRSSPIECGSTPRTAVRIVLAAALVVFTGCNTVQRLHLPRVNLPFIGAGGPYDLVIAGGTVVDGTGAPGYRADVAVVGDRIVRISKRSLRAAKAKRVIDATGRIVAPGFVDLHARLDSLPRAPDARDLVRQGVTSALGGLDGRSPLPLFLVFDTLRQTGLGVNAGFLIGQTPVLARVLGDPNRPPTLAQLDSMRRRVAEAMHDGAWGLSADLDRAPGREATTTEVVALAEVAGDSGGLFALDLRDAEGGPEADTTGATLVRGMAEALEIAGRAGVPVLISRMEVAGAPRWGAGARLLAMADSARAAGQRVWLSQVPFPGRPAPISALVPAWAMVGGRQAFLDRLWQPAQRDSIVDGIMAAITDGPGGGDLRRVVITDAPWQPDLDGRTLYDWAVEHHVEPVPEAAAELVIQALQRGGARVLLHPLSEDDIARIMRDAHTALVSGGRPAAFPYALARYVRQRHVLSLEQAVRRITALPAAIAGFPRRGQIREGWYADLVVFDSATVGGTAADSAAAMDPAGAAPEAAGAPAPIPWVVVNGRVQVDAGRYVGGRAGRLLLRPAHATRLHPVTGEPPAEPPAP